MKNKKKNSDGCQGKGLPTSFDTTRGENPSRDPKPERIPVTGKIAILAGFSEKRHFGRTQMIIQKERARNAAPLSPQPDRSRPTSWETRDRRGGEENTNVLQSWLKKGGRQPFGPKLDSIFKSRSASRSSRRDNVPEKRPRKKETKQAQEQGGKRTGKNRPLRIEEAGENESALTTRFGESRSGKGERGEKTGDNDHGVPGGGPAKLAGGGGRCSPLFEKQGGGKGVQRSKRPVERLLSRIRSAKAAQRCT